MRTSLDCVTFGRQLRGTLLSCQKPGGRCHGRVTQRENHSAETSRGD